MGLDNPVHLALIVVLVLLLFGAKRLPEIGRSLGSGMREFKQSISGEHPDQNQSSQQQPTLPAASPQASAQTVAQTAAQASAAASAQDAFAQRDPASTEQR